MFRQLTADTKIAQFDDTLVVQQQVHGPQVVVTLPRWAT